MEKGSPKKDGKEITRTNSSEPPPVILFPSRTLREILEFFVDENKDDEITRQFIISFPHIISVKILWDCFESTYSSVYTDVPCFNRDSNLPLAKKSETKKGKSETDPPKVETKKKKSEADPPKVETKKGKSEADPPKVEMKKQKTEKSPPKPETEKEKAEREKVEREKAKERPFGVYKFIKIWVETAFKRDFLQYYDKTISDIPLKDKLLDFLTARFTVWDLNAIKLCIMKENREKVANRPELTVQSSSSDGNISSYRPSNSLKNKSSSAGDTPPKSASSTSPDYNMGINRKSASTHSSGQTTPDSGGGSSSRHSIQSDPDLLSQTSPIQSTHASKIQCTPPPTSKVLHRSKSKANLALAPETEVQEPPEVTWEKYRLKLETWELSIRPHNVDKEVFCFLLQPDTEIAQQMTVIEYKTFVKIESSEFLQKNWQNKELKNKKAKNLLIMTNRFNLVADWVATSIVTEKNLDKRAKILEKFLNIQKELYALNNFISLFQIHAGLSMALISRLYKTWEKVNKTDFLRFEKLFDNEGGFINYKKHLAGIKGPVVPLLNIIQSQFALADEIALPDEIALTHETALADENGLADETENCTGKTDNSAGEKINLAKLIIMGKILFQWKDYQSQTFNFPKNDRLFEYLTNVATLPESMLWNHSFACEASKQ